jgi:hypothetical protein
MARRQKASDKVYWRTEVIAISFLGRTAVQGHAHPDWCITPILHQQASLGSECSLQGVAGRGKSGAKGIADGFEHIPAVVFDGPAQQGVMLRQRRFHGLRVGFPKPGTTLNVGEQKRHGS